MSRIHSHRVTACTLIKNSLQFCNTMTFVRTHSSTLQHCQQKKVGHSSFSFFPHNYEFRSTPLTKQIATKLTRTALNFHIVIICCMHITVRRGGYGMACVHKVHPISACVNVKDARAILLLFLACAPLCGS